MSIKIETFKKLRPTETYACTALEAMAWAKGLADLRIDFGKKRTFQWDARALNRPKIEGLVVASVLVNRQLKPILNFYPISASRYPAEVNKAFREEVLLDLRNWVEEQLAQGADRVLETEILLVELQGKSFKTHCLKYL
ncbi:MAG TPA: hypothetical protein VF531_15220 [Bacillota bacterium]